MRDAPPRKDSDGIGRSWYPSMSATLAYVCAAQIIDPVRCTAPTPISNDGAGSQILADLGLGKLRVMGTARKQVGLAGFGLEVVEYLEPGAA